MQTHDCKVTTSSSDAIRDDVRHRIEDERGFTLIETAIAFVVMMVAALAVASLFSYAIFYNTGAADRAATLSVAQQYCERLRKTPFAEVATTSEAQSITRSGRLYSVQVTVCTTADCGGSSTLKAITIQVTPRSAGNSWANNAVTIMSQRAAPSLGTYY
jgi:Tfp pilus assembly protein PilV